MFRFAAFQITEMRQLKKKHTLSLLIKRAIILLEKKISEQGLWCTALAQTACVYDGGSLEGGGVLDGSIFSSTVAPVLCTEKASAEMRFFKI
jgi:hypothetical protein